MDCVTFKENSVSETNPSTFWT